MAFPLRSPASGRRARLLAAAAIWSIVGCALSIVGAHWLIASAARAKAPLLLLAGVIGWAKGRFLLAPQARANVARILAADERRPLTEIFSATTWAVVAAMMTLGYVLRRSTLPRGVIGWIYAAVGVALLTGSTAAWSAWSRARTGLPEGGRNGPPPGVRA